MKYGYYFTTGVDATLAALQSGWGDALTSLLLLPSIAPPSPSSGLKPTQGSLAILSELSPKGLVAYVHCLHLTAQVTMKPYHDVP